MILYQAEVPSTANMHDLRWTTATMLPGYAAVGRPTDVTFQAWFRDDQVLPSDTAVEMWRAAMAAGIVADNAPHRVRETLSERAAQALETNRTYLALAAPTAAQTAAQVRALTRQVQALIRLNLGVLDGTD